jgi:hypothetical protein
MTRYTHQELDRDIAAPAGYYTPTKEVRLKLDGREVLYVLSQTVIDSSCCGVADFSSALVPGYIVKWKAEKSPAGNPVSLVEPITDKSTQGRIRKLIQEKENVSQTEFW